MNRKMWKHALPLGLACVMTAAAPMGALAASPEFARTSEEWAKLQDNVLEYGELEDLIAEYNTAVQTNQLDLAEFKRKYGNTKDDVSAKYRELANELYASVDYDSDDMSSIIKAGTVELQAKSMMENADNNLEDSEITWLNYKKSEKTLVTQAESNMIAYEKYQLQLQQAELAKSQAAISLASAQSKAANGLTTQVDILNAQETLQNADRTIESTKTSIETVRQKLQVSLGWKASDTPEIQPIPAADMSRIAAMNPEADQAAALENNYDLKINQKKLQNATTANVKESTEKTIADNERKIASSLVTAYQNVLASRLSYDQAVAALELEQRNMQTVQSQYQNGSISRNQYENQQYTLQSKQLDVQIADMNLFQTMESYDWAVKGLASTS